MNPKFVSQDEIFSACHASTSHYYMLSYSVIDFCCFIHSSPVFPICTVDLTTAYKLDSFFYNYSCGFSSSMRCRQKSSKATHQRRSNKSNAILHAVYTEYLRLQSISSGCWDGKGQNKREHSIARSRFTIGTPLTPSVYLFLFSSICRYIDSNGIEPSTSSRLRVTVVAILTMHVTCVTKFPV